MLKKIKPYIFLHLALLGYSMGAIFSKLAGNEPFLSFRFLFFYGCVLGILFLYAIVWQQILKNLPLVTAYSNKAVTVIWGIVWGAVFFQEPVTLRKIAGSLIIMAGVCLVAMETAAGQEEI